MVVGSDHKEEIKLMDFGIARLRDAGTATHLTQTGMIIGTPAYIAPEQIEGAEVSEQTDIYAFGIVLYEMLSGTVPFKAPTPSAVLIKHLQELPQPLRSLRREVPNSVEQIIMQALAKKPEKRQRNMVEIFLGLKQVDAAALAVRSEAVQARESNATVSPVGDAAIPKTVIERLPATVNDNQESLNLENSLWLVVAAVLAVFFLVLGIWTWPK
jgi:serine/threonine protein kinase